MIFFTCSCMVKLLDHIEHKINVYTIAFFWRGFYCIAWYVYTKIVEREYLTSIGKKLVVNNISFFSGGYFTTLLVYFDTQINEVKQNFFRKQKKILYFCLQNYSFPKLEKKNKAQVFYENRIWCGTNILCALLFSNFENE